MATIVPDTSTPKSANSSQLIERLGVVMSTFDDKTTKLLTFQQEAFNKSIKLLQDGATFATVGSSQRFRIVRAQTVLADVFSHLGDELFLLCAVGMTTAALSASPKSFITDLRCWWEARSPPQGLKAVASNICEKYSISSLVSKGSAGYGMIFYMITGCTTDCQLIRYYPLP
jgi:hypothetical protein